MDVVTERRRRAMPDGPIPPEFHYEGYRQSQLWLEVARRHAPSGLDAFYQLAFSRVPIGTFTHLIGLGAGGARKEYWLQQRITGEALHPDRRQRLARTSFRPASPPLGGGRPLARSLPISPGSPDFLTGSPHSMIRGLVSTRRSD